MRPVPCPIPASELSKLYSVDKLTDRQISERLGNGTTPKHVLRWRERFGIETLHRTERHAVLPIEGELRSLLIGSMLGDGRLDRQPNTTRYMENHCTAQRDYLEWKRQKWGGWSNRELMPVTWTLDGKQYPGVRFETVCHTSLNEWHSLFYDAEGPKHLLRARDLTVDPFAFTVWYLDDGCAAWWPEITFGMNSQSWTVAQEKFEQLGFSPRWQHVKGNTGVFHFEGEPQALRFIELVTPHVPECMQYKLTFGFQGPHYQVRQKLPADVLLDMASRGVPHKRIARILGVGHGTVVRHLEKLGAKVPQRIGRPLDTF